MRYPLSLPLIFLVITLGLSQFASAQNVEKVRGTSVLLNAGDMSLKVGDEYYTISDTGKKTGIIKISQVKGTHAVAKTLKGTVIEGESISLRGASATKGKSDSDASDSSENIRPIRKSKSSYGFFFGYSMDSLSMTAADNATPTQHTETANLSGSSIKLKGFYDYGMSNAWTFRFMGGYDGFNGTYAAQSTVINKDGSSTSKLAVTFISLDGELLWNLYKRNLTSFWLGGGYSFSYVASLSSNLFSLQLGASYLNAIFVGTGANIEMSKRSFLPLYVHYNYFIAGSGVSQTAINFGLGWGWTF